MNNTRARSSGDPGEEQATSSTGMYQAGWMTSSIMSDDYVTMIESWSGREPKNRPLKRYRKGEFLVLHSGTTV